MARLALTRSPCHQFIGLSVAHTSRCETDLIDRWDPLEMLGSQRRRLAGAYGLRFVGRSADTDQVTDCHEGEHLELFDLQQGDVVVTDRANGLRKRLAFVLSKCADIVVRI